MVQLVCRLEGQHESPHSVARSIVAVLSAEEDNKSEDALDVDEVRLRVELNGKFTETFPQRVLESLIGDMFHDDQSLKDLFQPDPVNGMNSSTFPSYLDSANSTIDPSLLTPFLMTQPSHPTRRLRRFRDPEELRMTLQIIDNTPVIDTHKVGVIYVAPGQSSEDEILSNQHGSPAYSKFIKKLGRVIKPNDNLEVYAAGLNPSLHGPYALAWWDDICQILFHVASFMPTFKREGNLHKKAEIGNDAVKIVWNEGGKPYSFDTIRSAYNLINLVIEPHTLMPKAAYQEESAHANGFFKVLLQTHPSLPKITPIGEFKLVAAETLPRLMRRYSTIACMFCHSWVSTGQDLGMYISLLYCLPLIFIYKGDKYPLVTNWQTRLDMINKTERFLVDETEDEEIMHGFSHL
jgi:tuberous sclerosis 2